ncbi:MAG: adenylate/guanylate cyclase domain-containing protein [Rhodospirillaceae bacterium]|nr:adenylate/guanylate cyclase domain-containing protein [Rhodospirillaceae bacterium]
MGRIRDHARLIPYFDIYRFWHLSLVQLKCGEKEFFTLKRRLAAILAADVVDYSRLMGEDQAQTLDALRQFRNELLEPVVTTHNGSIVKRLGDGWIIEFASVSDAVECALHIQNGLADHDVIRLRSGIHIGDVVFEEEDVFGDGVNVAARLEELAKPGELLISDTAYQSIDGKAAAQFSDGHSHQL